MEEILSPTYLILFYGEKDMKIRCSFHTFGSFGPYSSSDDSTLLLLLQLLRYSVGPVSQQNSFVLSFGCDLIA